MSKGGSQKTVQNTVSTPWGAAQPLLKKGLAQADALYDAGQLTADPYTGQRVADLSPETIAARSNIAAIAGNNPITGAATDAYTSMLSGSGYSNLDAVKQAALNSVLPSVSAQFSNAGMLNSSVAGQRMAEAATQAIAPIEYGAWENDQNRRLSLLGMAPQMQGLQYADNQMLGQIGAANDMRAQQLLDSDIAAYYETADRPYTDLQRLSGLAMGYGGMGGNTSGYSKGSTSDGGASTMQTIGSLVGLAAMAFSDRRLKRDIRPAGHTKEGYPQYRFKYLWSDQEHLGVMADEVPPELVVEIGGFKAVDYGRVTLDVG